MIQASKLRHEGISTTTNVWGGGWGWGVVFASINMVGTNDVWCFCIWIECFLYGTHTRARTHTHTHRRACGIHAPAHSVKSIHKGTPVSITSHPCWEE